ncbi:MAG: GspE/PulE family protein [Deltaproteobacteria bacterium]|nr:GspE/PulE family protein [Deltaproteobacteria bacterium]
MIAPAQSAAARTPVARAALALELIRTRKLGAQVLGAAGFATVEELADVVAAQFRLARVELDAVELNPELVALVPKALAEKHRIVPVFATADEVSIATADPTQIEVMDWLARELKRALTVVVATVPEIDRALRRLYAPRRAAQVEDGEDVSQEALAEATHVVNAIIAGALAQRASDIHVEATEHAAVVRYRVDGALRVVEQRPMELHAALVSRIKVLAQLDISVRHVPQDGRIKLRTNGGEIDLRVSVLPTYWGEKVVCRVLDNRKAALPLEAIGFDPAQRVQFERMVHAPYGLVLVTGPTGSGKSTTLYAALNAVRSPERNIVTVEDPIEYQLPGINQVHVNPKRGLTFASALRSILRQDPDVVLVGEIRDHETGVIAAEAALTGHLVLASLHTNDAIGAVTRLAEMGVAPHLVAPSLIGVVAQRLVRQICSDCAVTYAPTPDELAALGLPTLPPEVELARGTGCSACARSGYRGRIAIRELLEVDDGVRALIARGAGTEALRAQIAATGWRDLRFAALRLMLLKQTSVREVLRVTR